MQPGDPSPRGDVAIASARVASIVEAAERAAEELRGQTEQRARDRIAEAVRAADLRVEAAEAEAADLLATTRRTADTLTSEAREAVAGIHAEAALIRQEADDYALSARAEAALDAERMHGEAEERGKEIVAGAQADAREIIADAHAAAREVLRDGSELSGNLRELSDSLRTNADRLLRDVKLAHAHLTARLDDAAPGGAAPSARDTRPTAPADPDFDVPEFVPRG